MAEGGDGGNFGGSGGLRTEKEERRGDGIMIPPCITFLMYLESDMSGECTKHHS